MKKVILALAMCASVSGFAQVLNVSSVEKLNTPANPMATVAAISPQGDYLLLSTTGKQGLTKFDLGTNEATKITDALGAGFDVQISQDGSTVVYRENSFTSNHLRKVALKSINLANGSQATLVAPTRDLQGVALQGATALAVNKGKLSSKSIGAGATKATAPVLSICNRQLMITRNGKTEVFSPNGTNHSYIWQSISPDGTKALYFVCGVGAFVCNIDGSNVKSLGLVRAPQWYNNDIVVGMQDVDNGEFILSSKIVAVTLDGVMQTLTSSDIVAMNPYASAASGKIAFSTPAGEAYIINVAK